MKDRCYESRAETLAELKEEIIIIFATIGPEMLSLLLRNFVTTLEHVFDNDGRHIETVIF